MKKIKYMVLSALILLSTSCSDDFLDNANKDNPSQDVIFSTVDNAQLALNGLIRSLYDKATFFTQAPQNNFYDLGGFPTSMITMDYLGEDIPFISSPSGIQLVQAYTWDALGGSDNGIIEYNWTMPYLVINRANQIIEQVDAASGDKSIKDNIKGQAIAIRAFAYFHLVQLYGDRYDAGSTNSQLGPILYTVPTQSPQGRNTVAETYELINSDLDKSLELLELDNRSGTPYDKSYLDKSVVQGLKARVALVQEDWQTAIDMATAAIPHYSLMSNTEYQSGFNSFDNTEWMWGWNMEEGTRQENLWASFFSIMSYNGRDLWNYTSNNPKVIFSSLYNFLPDTDVRTSIFSEDVPDATLLPNGYTGAPYHSFKFEAENFSNTGQPGDVPVMRAAEMYLIKAEAEQRSGNDGTAAATLFALNSNRDPNYTLSTNTNQALLNEIWMYRRVELWGEGHRFKDLKRNNLPLDRTGGNHDPSIAMVMQVPAGDSKWTWRIPNIELERNDNINSN